MNPKWERVGQGSVKIVSEDGMVLYLNLWENKSFRVQRCSGGGCVVSVWCDSAMLPLKGWTEEDVKSFLAWMDDALTVEGER